MRITSKFVLPLVALSLSMYIAGCDFLGGDFLDRKPNDLLLEDQVWGDPKLIDGVLANFYNRLPEWKALSNNHHGFAQVDEAMWSGGGNDPNNLVNYPYDWWRLWDYNLVRQINQFIEKVQDAPKLSDDQKKAYTAEGRFLRAYMYFEMVKRMGGVPLIKQTYEYDFSGDPSYLQFPRNTEAEVYDFISEELDAIKNELPAGTDPSRANKWVALAMKSRAMLYAGSIAKYNNLMSQPITTPGGEVGIPADRATGYYEQALAAAKEIIDSGLFGLYDNNPDKGANFYEALTSKQNNREVIWVKDWTLEGKYHNWTYNMIPRSLREDNENGSELTPSLNLVEAFEYLDGSPGTLKTRTADGSDYVYYDNPEDIFANKDARLWGTVIYPGAAFKGKEVNVQAGLLVWNEQKGAYDEVTSNALGARDPQGNLIVGLDGPHPAEFHVTNTGFYLRKYVDSRPGAGQRGQGTDMWWVRYRYAEVLLNAAEAALELGRTGEALPYINEVRERAGFGPNSLSSLTIEDIQHERQVEFAFEAHRLFDLKRWRIAHEVWNGDPNARTTKIYALWPYRIVRPGDPRDGKYVYIEKVAPRFSGLRNFRMGNYYSSISDGVISANPKIVRNPFH